MPKKGIVVVFHIDIDVDIAPVLSKVLVEC